MIPVDVFSLVLVLFVTNTNAHIFANLATISISAAHALRKSKTVPAAPSVDAKMFHLQEFTRKTKNGLIQI